MGKIVKKRRLSLVNVDSPIGQKTRWRADLLVKHNISKKRRSDVHPTDNYMIYDKVV